MAVNLKFWGWLNLPSEDPSNYFAPDLEETVEWRLKKPDYLVRLHIPGLLSTPPTAPSSGCVKKFSLRL